jgi:8-oxo-dGTP pyrophosphatase MutT (NUDIX family)
MNEPLITLDVLRRGLRHTDAPASRMLIRSEHDGGAARPSGPPPGQTPKLAAVLVLIYPGAGGLTLALTERTSHLAKHAGQISFPGGHVDPEDTTLLDAALREADEELGIQARDVEVLGELRPVYIPPTNFLVHPFVAYAGRRPEFRPSPGEVAQVLDVPLAHLLDPATIVTEVRDIQGARLQVPYFRYEHHKIWGATAAMLDDLLARIDRERGR